MEPMNVDTQQAAAEPSSSPQSPVSPVSPATPGSRRSSRKSLTLDLSNLPPLTTPAQPSNTLLLTGLANPEIFRPDNLQTMRDLVASIAPIHSWSPLKSFRRIVVSFYDEDAAIRVREMWNGEAVMGERCKVYFGQPTAIDVDKEAQHLALPDAGKLFFISPPPSPPHGWEMRLEDAPNKMVHADDLADALSKLRHQAAAENVATMSPVSPTGDVAADSRRSRSRSSTLIFQPSEHGGSPGLPAISVEDMTEEPEEMGDFDMTGAPRRPITAHTARPPMELMNSA